VGESLWLSPTLFFCTAFQQRAGKQSSYPKIESNLISQGLVMYIPPPLELFLPQVDRMPQFVTHFFAERDNLDRLLTAPNTPYRRERFRQFYSAWEEHLLNTPFAELTHADQIDWLLLKNFLSAEKIQIEQDAKQWEEIEPLLPSIQNLLLLEEERRRHHFADPSSLAHQMDLIQRQIAQCREALCTEDLPSPVILHRASRYLQSVLSVLESWYRFREGYDPLFTWWVERPYQALKNTLTEYAEYLKQYAGANAPEVIIGDPIGRDALQAELDRNLIPYSPEELFAIGEREMAWCQREMVRAAQELGYGENWRDALEYVKSLHPAPGEQIAVVRDLAFEAIVYVTENDWLTLPSLARECWRMEMMSPEMQRINPFFLGGEEIIVSSPTNTMEHSQKSMSMRGNNRHFSRATVQHELIPGHHLQLYSMDRYRPYRQRFYTPFWIEGWTLHWEMFLWDNGFPRSPEDRIGMLFWRMHRCARIRFSLGFHLGQFTPQECIEILVNDVGHERDNATAEVRRSFGGDYDPLYQCAYLIGGLQVRALHAEMTQKHKWTDKQFHDAMLHQNCMPISLLRSALLQEPLTTDFRPQWRFDTL
jgi:hypothetical protein